jgi:hypothetical protein
MGTDATPTMVTSMEMKILRQSQAGCFDLLLEGNRLTPGGQEVAAFVSGVCV